MMAAYSTATITIAVDGRNLMHPVGGSGSYIIAALNELSALRPEWHFCLLTNRPLHPSCSERIFWRDNVKHVCQGYTRIGLLWYSTQLYFILKKLKPDFFWAPATLLPPCIPSGIKTIVTVNDLVAKDHRSTMATMNRLYSDLMFDHSIMTADILLSISKYTASEIEARYPERRAKMIEVGCGVDNTIFMPLGLSSKECDEVASKYGVTPPFLLFVGTLEPRKNLDFMLRLAPRLVAEELCILIVGAKGWGKSRLAEIVTMDTFPKEKVVFAGYVPTEDLVKLYNAAAVYVSTSYNEGFGLPQLEAMNCGCPVVSPHNSAMIEVVEGAGLTVEGWDPDIWCDSILTVFKNREHYRNRGFQRAKLFEWPDIAQGIVRILGDT